MSVTTKVPASRAGGGASVPPPGPISVPRVVGNRRIRAGGVALAVMLLALGAALSGIALVSASRTSAYIAIARQVTIGAQLQAADFKTVELAGGAGLAAIPAADIPLLVGQYAKVQLVAGTLAVPAEFGKSAPFDPTDAQIGLAVKAANMASKTLSPGDDIWLIPTGNDVTAGQEYSVTIVDISIGADGNALLHIAVPVSEIATVAPLAASGAVTIVLKPKG